MGEVVKCLKVRPNPHYLDCVLVLRLIARLKELTVAHEPAVLNAKLFLAYRTMLRNTMELRGMTRPVLLNGTPDESPPKPQP